LLLGNGIKKYKNTEKQRYKNNNKKKGLKERKTTK
jgi:hypothetical protein